MIVSKKAMGIGQVFIFIVAVVTFAVIMIFGYKAVTDFLDQGEKVQFHQFKTGLESSVKRIYTEYGSVRIQEFNIPGGYEQVCFVDLNKPKKDDLCLKNQIACDVWESSQGYDTVDENVFLKPQAPSKIKVFNIKMENDFLCLPVVKGKFTVHMEGKGDHTYLSKPQS
jgi:hypothetical protein